MMRRLSLRGRMILLVLAGVLPSLAFNLGGTWLTYRRDRAEAGAQALNLARSIAHAVASELNTRIAALEVLTLSDALAVGDLVAFRAQAEAVLALQQPGANILLLQANGQQVMNTARPPGTPLPARRALENQRRVLETRRPAVSNLYTGLVVQRPVIGIDVPVRGSGALWAQVVSMNPSPDAFTEVIARQRPTPGWYVTLIDGTNLRIARLPDNDALLGHRVPEEFIAKSADRPEAVIEITSPEGDRLILGYGQVPGTAWSVAVGVPLEAVTGPARRAALAGLAVGMALLLLGLALAQLVARGILGPINALRRLAVPPEERGAGLPATTGLPETDVVAAALAAEASQRRDAMASLRDSERRLRLVVAELNHRAKNALATVQALAAQTARGEGGHDPQRFAATFNARLQSLARAHDLLTAFAWEAAALDAVVRAGLAPWLAPGSPGAPFQPRITLDCRCCGAPPNASPGQAQALVLALHELATNAVKHGALSTAEGQVMVTCRTEGKTAVIEWREAGGPPIAGPPDERGFGTRLLERSLAHDLGPGSRVALDFAPAGLCAEIRFATRQDAAAPLG